MMQNRSPSNLQVRRTADDDEQMYLVLSEAVSDAAGVPQTDLSPLGFVVEADALDALFETRSPNGRLMFDYAGFRVVVHADRTVEVFDE